MSFAIQSAQSAAVLSGLDTLFEENDAGVPPLLRGRRIGILTNHTGRTRQGGSTLSALRSLNLDIRALFSPEHGIEGKREGDIASSETKDQLPIYSLYGETRRPTSEMLREIDILVCDLQDVGARFYTYAGTLAHCMEECAAREIAVVVLDRPNPIGGEIVEGPLIDKSARSFVGYLDVPIRHGMTMGELALLFQSDAKLKMELHVAKMRGWKRAMFWPQTGLKWPVPSPNLPDFQSALWYPGICLLEFSKVSVGRGTQAPFQIIGAPWLGAAGVLRALENEPIFTKDFQAEIITFTPARGEHEGAICSGLKFSTQHSAFSPQRFVPLGLFLLSVLHRVQPQEFGAEKLQAALPLLGASGVLPMLREGAVPAALEIAEHDAEKFLGRRKSFLLYQ
jgi:uncharacterized protein YbbC (DUF1343 family)